VWAVTQSMDTHRTHLKTNEAAEVGIGTMIVFIAAILVAAIAAGVLINTAQKLQAKSQQTGSEATQNVVGALNVLSVDGVVASGQITDLVATVQLAAGAEPLDLSKLVINLNDGSAQVSLNACDDTTSDATATPATFTPGDWLRPNDSTGCGVMKSGDLVQLTISQLTLGTSTKISLTYVPAHGSQSVVSFTTPDGFGDATRISLF